MSNYLSKLKEKVSGAHAAPESSPTEAPEKPLKEKEVKMDTATQKKERALERPLQALIEIKNNLILPETEKQFFLSQTLIKAVTDRHGYLLEVCPRFIYENYIQKKYREVTLPMMHGMYGETAVLGGGAKGQVVKDLPRHKKNGEKLAAQKNIDEQAHRFNKWCLDKGVNIIPSYNTQLPIAKKFSEKVMIRTEIDVFPTTYIDKTGIKLAVMDIKFTGDVNNTSGSFCWGAPEFIDHIQADMTYWLLQDFDMELNLKYNPEKEEIYKAIFENQTILNMIKNEQVYFIYFVIGYKKQPLEEQVRFLHREYREPNGSLFRQNEWQERARKTMAQLREWAGKNWAPLPGNYCDKCPVSQRNGGYCDKFAELKSI